MSIDFEIKGPTGSLTPAEAAFKSATQYFEGALRCAQPVDNPHKENSVLFPAEVAVVNVAFSAELFLKSLLLAAGGNPAKIHRLDGLYSKLGDDLQKRIRKRYCQLSETPTLKMKDHLTQISTAFVDWRYSFEQATEIGVSRYFHWQEQPSR